MFIGFHLKIFSCIDRLDTDTDINTAPAIVLTIYEHKSNSNKTNQQQLLDEYDEHKPASKKMSFVCAYEVALIYGAS